MPAPAPRAMRPSAGAAVVPGSQSTYISPISDWGRIAQVALAWNGANRASSIWSVTAAWLCLVTSSEAIEPTGAPATRTCSPATANEASSKIARTR